MNWLKNAIRKWLGIETRRVVVCKPSPATWTEADRAELLRLAAVANDPKTRRFRYR